MLQALLEDPLKTLPPARGPTAGIPHAPRRKFDTVLSAAERELALSNALRYVPVEWHAVLGPEWAQEIALYGHIYAYRFRPTEYVMKAHPIQVRPQNETRQTTQHVLS